VLHEQFDMLTSHTLGNSSSSRSNGVSASSSSTVIPTASTHQYSSTRQYRYHHTHHHYQPTQQQEQEQQWWWQRAPIRPTVIQIAHELSAIMSYDTVAVMSGGQVVEMGNPQELAAQEGSRFSRLRAQEGH
jgi:ABC-type sugar transport system ATPase subunit